MLFPFVIHNGDKTALFAHIVYAVSTWGSGQRYHPSSDIVTTEEEDVRIV